METRGEYWKFALIYGVLTVPMRNGNVKTKIIKLVKFRSYRTYEEWKQNNTREYYPRALCSYRTYEEWKPDDDEFYIYSTEQFLPYL